MDKSAKPTVGNKCEHCGTDVYVISAGLWVHTLNGISRCPDKSALVRGQKSWTPSPPTTSAIPVRDEGGEMSDTPTRCPDKSTPSKESLERARDYLESSDRGIDCEGVALDGDVEELALEFDTIRRERDEVAEKLAEALRERHDPIDCRIGPNCSACKALAAYRERMGR